MQQMSRCWAECSREDVHQLLGGRMHCEVGSREGRLEMSTEGWVNSGEEPRSIRELQP